MRYQALKIASAVFGAGLALQAPIVAHAAEPTRAASLSSKVALAPQTAGSTLGGITPMHVATECGGRTDLPHRSNGFASVHGVTHCSYAAPLMASVSLGRERWWGMQWLANGYKESTTTSVNANAKWYCVGTGTYTYVGETYHRAMIHGSAHINYTRNSDRFSC